MDKNTFLINLSASPKTDFGKVDFDKQSPLQRVFSAIWELESEVNSGGFAHYFSSVERDSITFASTALRTIGALRCAAIVDRALLIGPSGDTSAISNEFMAYPDNLTELLYAFVASHPESFGAVGEMA